MSRNAWTAKQKGIDTYLANREENQDHRRYFTAESTQWVRDALERAEVQAVRLSREEKRALRYAKLRAGTPTAPIVKDAASMRALKRYVKRVNRR